jgi:hypothetical protein
MKNVTMVQDLSDVLPLAPEPSVVMVLDKLPLPTTKSVIWVKPTLTPTPLAVPLSVL